MCLFYLWISLDLAGRMLPASRRAWRCHLFVDGVVAAGCFLLSCKTYKSDACFRSHPFIRYR